MVYTRLFSGGFGVNHLIIFLSIVGLDFDLNLLVLEGTWFATRKPNGAMAAFWELQAS